MSAEAIVKPSLAEASRALLVERVLDAVGELLAEKSWGNVSMAAIAGRAGVSRQTLYNSFGNRQELAQAYVMREGERFVTAVGEAVRGHRDPSEALRAALELFLVAAAPHPLVRAITAGEGEELLPLVTTRGAPLVEFVTQRLALVIDENWPGIPSPEVQLLSDCLVRLALSHAALPAGPAPRAASDLAYVLGPHLDRLVAGIEAAGASSD
ncbi:TetR family transcriptional regulator [soil metagenome]